MSTKPKKKPSAKKKPGSPKAKPAKSAKAAKPSKPARAAGTDPKRVAAILTKLDEAYGNATCELKHENAFQLLISTILSAQCTDVCVNQVAETLYKKYPDPKAFAYATPSELEQDIRPTGFFRNKTKSVMGASKAIIEKFGGQVPHTMEEILTLPGVARKTANVVLGTAYGIASGVVVEEGRTGFDEDHSSGEVDPVFPPTDLARTPGLPRAQAKMHRVQHGIALLRERQNGLRVKCRQQKSDERGCGGEEIVMEPAVQSGFFG